MIDEKSNATAPLFWRVDSVPDFTTVDMLDDGEALDSAAHDNVFTAIIPAHADRTVVEFYVEASDELGNSRTWPAPIADGTQSANALYQVIDDIDLDASWDPEDVPVYFQIMTTAERREFTNATRQSDAQFNATFIASRKTASSTRFSNMA